MKIPDLKNQPKRSPSRARAKVNGIAMLTWPKRPNTKLRTNTRNRRKTLGSLSLKSQSLKQKRTLNWTPTLACFALGQRTQTPPASSRPKQQPSSPGGAEAKAKGKARVRAGSGHNPKV